MGSCTCGLVFFITKTGDHQTLTLTASDTSQTPLACLHALLLTFFAQPLTSITIESGKLGASSVMDALLPPLPPEGRTLHEV